MMQHVLSSILLVSAYRSGAADSDDSLVSPFDGWHPEDRLDESFLRNRDEIAAAWHLQIIEALQQNERAKLFPESDQTPEQRATEHHQSNANTRSTALSGVAGRLRRAEAAAEAGSETTEGSAESQLQAIVDELTATSKSEKIRHDGIALFVADKQGKTLFDIRTSKMTPTKKMNLASGSKMIAGITLLKCINDTPSLTLESTTGEILGWTGKNKDITIRKLGGFATGDLKLEDQTAFNVCKMNPWKTNQECVDEHLKNGDFVDPGTNRYEPMGESHHIVAAMCEKASGRNFMAWFNDLKAALGINDKSFTYACAACYDVNAWFPFGTASTWVENPNLAAGLSANAVGLTKFLNLVLNKGAYNGKQLIAPTLLENMGRNPYYKTAEGAEKMAVNYGFFTMRDPSCKGKELCGAFGHAGMYGMRMWVNMDSGYTCVLMMMANPLESVEESLAGGTDEKKRKLENDIKSVIDRVLAPTATPNPTPNPTPSPTKKPATPNPTPNPTTMRPTPNPTPNPTPSPTKKPVTPERNFETAEGCTCKKAWSYKGKTYHGCNVTPDTKKPWCRVSGPDACTKGWRWIFTSPWDWCKSAMVTNPAASQ